jgi:UbiD family decarboxylase
MTVVALRQRYAGHAKRAGLFAAAQSYMAKLVVIVDEDVDRRSWPTSCGRSRPAANPRKQSIIRTAWSSALDPRLDAAAARPRIRK